MESDGYGTDCGFSVPFGPNRLHCVYATCGLRLKVHISCARRRQLFSWPGLSGYVVVFRAVEEKGDTSTNQCVCVDDKDRGCWLRSSSTAAAHVFRWVFALLCRPPVKEGWTSRLCALARQLFVRHCEACVFDSILGRLRRVFVLDRFWRFV